MAKPKVKNLVEVITCKAIRVYCNNPSLVLEEIGRIEGVSSVLLFDKMISALIDPRYDVGEVAQEIRDLLEQDVPEVFRE